MSGTFDSTQSNGECPICKSLRCSFQFFQYNAGGCISNHHRIICECGYRDIDEPDFDNDGGHDDEE